MPVRLASLPRMLTCIKPYARPCFNIASGRKSAASFGSFFFKNELMSVISRRSSFIASCSLYLNSRNREAFAAPRTSKAFCGAEFPVTSESKSMTKTFKSVRVEEVFLPSQSLFSCALKSLKRKASHRMGPPRHMNGQRVPSCRWTKVFKSATTFSTSSKAARRRSINFL